MTAASTLPRYAHRRGTRGFAAIVTLLAGAVVLGVAVVAAPRAALDPAFVSWLVIGALAFGGAHVVAAYGLIRRRAWSGVLVGYLATIGIGVAVYGLLLDHDRRGSVRRDERAAVRPGLGRGRRAAHLDDRAVGRRRAVRAQGRAARRAPGGTSPPGPRPPARPPDRYPRSAMPIETQTLYDRAGGTPFFEALVDRFYAGVATDPLLRPIYPEADLAGATRRLRLFLIQYWGGPTTYDDERGHPRLRMRHMPFAIGPAERDRWLVHMRAAVADLAPPDDVAAELERYFAMAAEAMRQPLTAWTTLGFLSVAHDTSVRRRDRPWSVHGTLGRCAKS